MADFTMPLTPAEAMALQRLLANPEVARIADELYGAAGAVDALKTALAEWLTAQTPA